MSERKDAWLAILAVIIVYGLLFGGALLSALRIIPNVFFQ